MDIEDFRRINSYSTFYILFGSGLAGLGYSCSFLSLGRGPGSEDRKMVAKQLILLSSRTV